VLLLARDTPAVYDDRTPYPRPSQPGTVWLVAPGSDTDRPGFTGVHHADVECPVLRTWIERDPSRAQLLEVDANAGQTTAAWECDWQDPDGWEWFRERRRFDLNRWRACLRCGSLPNQVKAVTCSRCFLIGCDCDEN
jgi:hypothetical protein